MTRIYDIRQDEHRPRRKAPPRRKHPANCHFILLVPPADRENLLVALEKTCGERYVFAVMSASAIIGHYVVRGGYPDDIRDMLTRAGWGHIRFTHWAKELLCGCPSDASHCVLEPDRMRILIDERLALIHEEFAQQVDDT